MKLVIQVAEADDAKAWAVLQRHSAGLALPNRTFVISEEAAEALRRTEVRFHVLSDDPHTLTREGATAGERI